MPQPGKPTLSVLQDKRSGHIEKPAHHKKEEPRLTATREKAHAATEKTQLSSVSVVSDSSQPHALQHSRPPCPSPTPWSLLKLMSFESVRPSNHLILCCPLLLPPSIFPSIRVFSNESVIPIRWPKYWSFSFNEDSAQP